MNHTTPKRKSPRLKDFPYVGPYVYNLTFVTRRRRPVLTERSVANVCLYALDRAAEKQAFIPYAYCIMPDHMHLLAGGSDGSSLRDFAKHFKQVSRFAYKQERGEHLWQISYFDHVLRSDEALQPIAQYIWNNPVRAGLATSRAEWPYNGPAKYVEETA